MKEKGLDFLATIIYAIFILQHYVFVNIEWYPLGEMHLSNDIPFELYGIRDIFIMTLESTVCMYMMLLKRKSCIHFQ